MCNGGAFGYVELVIKYIKKRRQTQRLPSDGLLRFRFRIKSLDENGLTAILGANSDNMSPAERITQFGEILSAKWVNNYVKIYSGVVHGFTVRYYDDDEHAVKCAMEAHSDMLN